VTTREVLVAALQRIAGKENSWSDVDPWDGLAINSVREFASDALKIAGEKE